MVVHENEETSRRPLKTHTKMAKRTKCLDSAGRSRGKAYATHSDKLTIGWRAR